MFNDILTGKASIEPPKVAPDPYREQAPMPPTLVCTRCGVTFPTPQAVAGVCRSCRPQSMQGMNLLMPDSISYVQAAADERGRQARNLAFKIVLLVIFVIGVAFFRYGMREQAREDMQKASGHYSP